MNPGMPLQFIAEADPSQTYVVLGVLLVFVLFVALGSRLGSKSGPRSGRMSIGRFRRQARRAGLSRDQVRILERGIKTQEIPNPGSLLTHGGMLNRCLRTMIQEIRESETPDAQKDAVIGEIFAIKRLLSNQQRSAQGPSSQILQQGQPLTLLSKHSPPFETFITGTLEGHLAVEQPKTPQGIPVKFKRGETVRIRLVRDTGKVYRFDTKVLEDARIEGIDVILVDHVKSMEEIQMRKYPRKEMNKPCYFQKVEIVTEGTGKKAVRRAVVQKNRRFLGQLEDISVGGCALFSRTPIPKNNLVKLAFDIQTGMTVQAYGKVLHVRGGRGTGQVMHIAFTRVSRKHINEIQSFVYGLAGPDVY